MRHRAIRRDENVGFVNSWLRAKHNGLPGFRHLRSLEPLTSATDEQAHRKEHAREFARTRERQLLRHREECLRVHEIPWLSIRRIALFGFKGLWYAGEFRMLHHSRKDRLAAGSMTNVRV